MRVHKIVEGGLAGFIVGVGLGSYFQTSVSLCLLLIALGVAFLATFRNEKSFAFFVGSLAFWGGVVLTTHTLHFWESLPDAFDFQGETIILSVEDPKVFYRPVTLQSLSCQGECPKIDILFQAPLTFSGIPGDRVILECSLARPENFDTKFDYRSYLAMKGVGYVCSQAEHFQIQTETGFSLRKKMFLLREAVASGIEHALTQPEAGLALGLLLGGNDFLSKETADAFSRTGLSHIVAISGYNMAVIVQFTLMAGLFVGLWRKQAILFSLAFIILFLFFAGAPASGIRAALMTGVAFGAFFTGRLSLSWNALRLAITLMILFNPLALRYDVGLELSALATLALLLMSPLVEKYISLEKWWGKGLALMSFTVVIQLLTLPVLLASFGQASYLAPITNLLVLPLVPLAMLLLLFALPPIFLAPALVPFFVFPLWLILAIQVKIVEFFARLPFGLVHSEGMGPITVLVWYTVLALVFRLLSRENTAYARRETP